jgi:hypothetical protein
MIPASCFHFHPFTETLKEWEMGIPVDCGAPWKWVTIKVAIAKGAHKSAMTDESVTLITEDAAYQVNTGDVEIITWEELYRVRPKNLKVSPAVVPQRYCRGRMILDLSFAV